MHKESLHLVKLNLRIKDTIFIDEFEVLRTTVIVVKGGVLYIIAFVVGSL